MAVLIQPACGVRQFNGQVSPSDGSSGRFITAYGPFYAAGQNGEGMAAAGCQSQAGRPCIRARASAGIPFGFDVNPNNQMGRVPDGSNVFPAAPQPYGDIGAGGYAAKAEAGKLSVPAGPFGPHHPRMENRDLALMQRQAEQGEHIIAP